MADNRIDTQLERLSAAKTAIKEAIIEKLPVNETFSAEKLDGYPNEIRKITTTKELTGATATENDILAGKTAYGNNGAKINGAITIYNNTQINIQTSGDTSFEQGYYANGGTIKVPASTVSGTTTITKKGDKAIIGKGYLDSAKTVSIATEEQNKIIPSNIKYHQTILGVTGSFTEEKSNPITSESVLYGKKGFVNGIEVEGSIPTYEGNIETDWAPATLIYNTMQVLIPDNLPNNYSAKLYRNGSKANSVTLIENTTNIIELTKNLSDGVSEQTYDYQLKVTAGENQIYLASSYISFPKMYKEVIVQKDHSCAWEPVFVGLENTQNLFYTTYTQGGITYFDLPLSDPLMSSYKAYEDFNKTTKIVETEGIFNYNNIYTDDSGKKHSWHIPESYLNKSFYLFRETENDGAMISALGANIYSNCIKITLTYVESATSYIDVQYQLATEIAYQKEDLTYVYLYSNNITLPTYKTEINDYDLSEMLKNIDKNFTKGQKYTVTLRIIPGGKNYSFSDACGGNIAYSITIQ